ncbi:hypothetical protein [Nesterenkonia rhizosphaerae]|uniref:Major capsid protein n=1 Tax=Nesterenkonia rhizosphaerae TaxID=1348272 RepID=A0ABP9FTM9_9MICC
MSVYPPEQVQAPTVEDFINNPTEVRRILDNLTRGQTIADYLLGQGPANNGAVVYDEVTGLPEEGSREVGAIAPGGEFPIVDGEQIAPRTAKVQKFGGAVELTFEAIRRNERDILQKKMRLLQRLVIKRVNAVCVNAITANPHINTYGVSAGWLEESADPIGNLYAAISQINDNDLGYEADTAIINPNDAHRYLLGQERVRKQLPRESRADNPVLNPSLDGLVGLEWITSNRVSQGEIYLAQRGVSGSVRDEEGGVQTYSYDLPGRQVRVLQGWRSMVPIITDPKSITRITGFTA